MNDKKAPQTSEQSLRYMAWDVKQISENLKILTQCVQALTEDKCGNRAPPRNNLEPQGRLPF